MVRVFKLLDVFGLDVFQGSNHLIFTFHYVPFGIFIRNSARVSYVLISMQSFTFA